MGSDELNVPQAAYEAALLPFRFPKAFVKVSSPMLAFCIAIQVQLASLDPLLNFAGNFDGGWISVNWTINILTLLGSVTVLSFVVGWYRVAYFGEAEVPKCRWLNLDRAAGRLLLRSVGVAGIFLVLFIGAAVILLVLGLLGGVLAIRSVTDPIFKTAMEFAIFWFFFQFSMSLVSAVVDEPPLRMFDCWLMKDRCSLGATLAMWLIYKLGAVLAFLLLWSTSAIEPASLLEDLFHIKVGAENNANATSPVWVWVANGTLGFITMCWSAGFMAAIYRRAKLSRNLGERAAVA